MLAAAFALAAGLDARVGQGSLVNSFLGQLARDKPGHTHVLPKYPAYAHDVLQLDGLWAYSFSPESAADAESKPRKKLWVPNVLQEDNTALRGFAVYERHISVPKGHHGRLQFYGCGFRCTVKLDGELKQEHAGAYTVFWVDVPEGEHKLRVTADTLLEDHGVDQPWYDFMEYGGLIRPVVLHTTRGSSMIEGVDLIQHSAEKGTLRFRLHRFTKEHSPLAVHVSGSAVGEHDLDVDEEHLEHPVDLQGKRWSPASPELSLVSVSFAGSSSGKVHGEGLTIRVGLRTVSACEGGDTSSRVCIDGKPEKLLGFCMHNMDPVWQQTAPRERVEQWLKSAKAAGNFLRLVHYPHDALTLELADELGLMLWTETLGWGNKLEDLVSPTFQQAQVAMLDEAVPTTFNHPSVVLYGFLNEADDSRDEACGLYDKLVTRYRDWKVNGLVVWASNQYGNDRCLGTADVVAFNTYPGWYSDSVETIPKVLGDYAKLVQDKYPGKPFIVSEVGASAIPPGVKWSKPQGQLAMGAQFGWSEDYQAAVDGQAAKAVVCDPKIGGVAIWQLFDTRTSEKRTPLRPRGMNNKGVLTEEGVPKESYKMVQAAFQNDCAKIPASVGQLRVTPVDAD